MTTLPASDDPLFIRTHFDHPAAWDAICQAIRLPSEQSLAGFADFAAINALIGQDVGEAPQACLTLVDDPAFADLTPTELLKKLPPHSLQGLLFVVDKEAMTNPDHPILVLDALDPTGRSFRAIPSQIQTIENNLSLGNCDWEDFAEHVDDDGVFRGVDE
jgi:hypothetical protein